MQLYLCTKIYFIYFYVLCNLQKFIKGNCCWLEENEQNFLQQEGICLLT